MRKGDLIYYLIIADNVEEGDDVGSPTQNLQDFNLPFDLFLFDGFKDFDDAFLVADDVYALKDFGVLATTNLPYNFIVIRVTTPPMLAPVNYPPPPPSPGELFYPHATCRLS